MRALPVPVWVTLLFGLFVAANETRHAIDGREKLAAAGLSASDGRANVDVVLNVPPEAFHMTRLQRWGTMTGVQDRTVRLRNVPARDLPALAREPWVASLEAARG